MAAFEIGVGLIEVQLLFDLLASTLSKKMHNKTVASGAISTVVLISSFTH